MTEDLRLHVYFCLKLIFHGKHVREKKSGRQSTCTATIMIAHAVAANKFDRAHIFRDASGCAMTPAHVYHSQPHQPRAFCLALRTLPSGNKSRLRWPDRIVMYRGIHVRIQDTRRYNPTQHKKEQGDLSELQVLQFRWLTRIAYLAHRRQWQGELPVRQLARLELEVHPGPRFLNMNSRISTRVRCDHPERVIDAAVPLSCRGEQFVGDVVARRKAGLLHATRSKYNCGLRRGECLRRPGSSQTTSSTRLDQCTQQM